MGLTTANSMPVSRLFTIKVSLQKRNYTRKWQYQLGYEAEIINTTHVTQLLNTVHKVLLPPPSTAHNSIGMLWNAIILAQKRQNIAKLMVCKE